MAHSKQSITSNKDCFEGPNRVKVPLTRKTPAMAGPKADQSQLERNGLLGLTRTHTIAQTRCISFAFATKLAMLTKHIFLRFS